MKIVLKIGIDEQAGTRCVQSGIALGRLACAIEQARKMVETPGTSPGLASWYRHAEKEAGRLRRMLPKASVHVKAIQAGLERWQTPLNSFYGVSAENAPEIAKALDSMEADLRAVAKESLRRCGRRMPTDADADRALKEARTAAKPAPAPKEVQAPPPDVMEEMP